MSKYAGYTVQYNVKRKKNNTGQSVECGPNKNCKRYTSTGSAVGHLRDKVLAETITPVRVYSASEIAEYEAQKNSKK